MNRLLIIASSCFAAGAATGQDSVANEEQIRRGQATFVTCAACHAASSEVPNQGPDLKGVVGRRAGSLPGFRYSRALRAFGRVWTDEALAEFLEDPQAAIPGNTMPFPGLPEEEQRRDLIAYLKTLK